MSATKGLKQPGKNWRSRRQALIERLGGRCVKCGSKAGLVFDHKRPRRWQPEKLSKESRLEAYERSAAKGRIQLLCTLHHNQKTAQEAYGWTPFDKMLAALTDPEPF